MEQINGDRQLLTVSEVARRLRVDSTTVRRWIKEGALDAILLPGKQNKKYRIDQETLDGLLNNHSG
jgi:excisionase family DNA binding protein